MGDILDDIDQVLAEGEPDPPPELCPHCGWDWHGLPTIRDDEVICPGGHEPVMVCRPAPCDCDLCSGRLDAYLTQRPDGMRQMRVELVDLDENDPQVRAAIAQSRRLIEAVLGPP